MSTLRYKIASVPDREELVYEIWLGDDMIAEVSVEGAGPLIEFYIRDHQTIVDFAKLVGILFEIRSDIERNMR